MKLSSLVGDRFKERPSDCVVESHALMLRGGYIKGVANGIFSLFPPTKNIVRKIENIIREEMNAVDGQEVLFPVVMPASLWRESGRYDAIGKELVRFSDRADADMVLGMTHEEAAVHLVRSYAQTYAKYPFMIYQIQTKFRDEPRARAGLIRVREFTMKDGYSFHTNTADLEDYYARCHRAYERIFARAGIPEVVSVLSDSGMMGGKIAHEFMLLTDAGEDTIATCRECGYSANADVAPCVHTAVNGRPVAELSLVSTPDKKTIEEVCEFLGAPIENACKAVVYQKNSDDSYVVVFIRGDMETNDVKLEQTVGEAVHPAEIDENSGIVAGFIGPCGLDKKHTVVFDRSLEGIEWLVAGANKKDCHYTGFNISRDYGECEYADVGMIRGGDVCPQCKKFSIALSRGIEVGNIFQLGDRYTRSMGMTYTDADGSEKYPIMGCYGIGVGRLAASVCEARRDGYGPIWPITIAPWEVEVCCLRSDDEASSAAAEKIYKELSACGIETLYDDREVRPGPMLSDADLLGVPVRVIVSPRNLSEDVAELVTRDKSVSKKVPLEAAVSETKELVKQLYDAVERLVPKRI